MPQRVRPFADRDYAGFVRLLRRAEGELRSIDDARALDARWDHGRYEKVRVIAVDEEDAPLGYGEIYHEPSRFDPRRYFLRLGVDRRLRRGIGAALWDHLRAELDERAARVVCLWARDRTACHAFIARRGFAEVIRAFEQVLALATARIPLAGARERAAAAGIGVRTLAELRATAGESALHAAHDLHTISRRDQPTLGLVTPAPYADWLAYNVTAPEALPDAYFVATDGSRLVGCSSVRRESEDQLRIGITAVLPEYRRRGLGRLLKLEVHDWGRRNGYREIHTSTTAPNTAMLALNTALGYAIVGSWGGYELGLTT